MTTPDPLTAMTPAQRYEAVGRHYGDSEHSTVFRRLRHQRNLITMSDALHVTPDADSDQLIRIKTALKDLTQIPGWATKSFEEQCPFIQDRLAAYGIYLSPGQVVNYFKDPNDSTKLNALLLQPLTVPPAALTAADNARHKLLFQILHDAIVEDLKTKDQTLKNKPASTVAKLNVCLERVKKALQQINDADGTPAHPYKSLNDLYLILKTTTGDKDNQAKEWDVLFAEMKLDQKGKNVERNAYVAAEYYRLAENHGLRELGGDSLFVKQAGTELGAPATLRRVHDAKTRRGADTLQSIEGHKRVISYVNLPYTSEVLARIINESLTLDTFAAAEKGIGGKPNPFFKLPKFKIGDSDKIYMYAVKLDGDELKWFKQELVESEPKTNPPTYSKQGNPSLLSQSQIRLIKNVDGSAMAEDFFDQVLKAQDELIKAYDFNVKSDTGMTNASLVGDAEPMVFEFSDARLSSAAPEPAPALSDEDKHAHLAAVWGVMLEKVLKIEATEFDAFRDAVVALIDGENVRMGSPPAPALLDRLSSAVGDEQSLLEEIVENIRNALNDAKGSRLMPAEIAILNALVAQYDTSRPTDRASFNTMLTTNNIELDKAVPPGLERALFRAQSHRIADREPLTLFGHAEASDAFRFNVLTSMGNDYLTYGFAKYVNAAGTNPIVIEIDGQQYAFKPTETSGGNNSYAVYTWNSDGSEGGIYIPENKEKELAFRAGLAQCLLKKAKEALPATSTAERDALDKVKILMSGKNDKGEPSVVRHEWNKPLSEADKTSSKLKPGS